MYMWNTIFGSFDIVSSSDVSIRDMVPEEKLLVKLKDCWNFFSPPGKFPFRLCWTQFKKQLRKLAQNLARNRSWIIKCSQLFFWMSFWLFFFIKNIFPFFEQLWPTLLNTWVLRHFDWTKNTLKNKTFFTSPKTPCKIRYL